MKSSIYFQPQWYTYMNQFFNAIILVNRKIFQIFLDGVFVECMELNFFIIHSVAWDGFVHVVWNFQLKRRVVMLCLKNIAVRLINQIKLNWLTVPRHRVRAYPEVKNFNWGGLLTHGENCVVQSQVGRSIIVNLGLRKLLPVSTP